MSTAALPSVSRHVAHLADEVVAGNCLLLLATDRDDPMEIATELSEEFARRELYTESVQTTDAEQPLELISGRAEVEWGRSEPRTIGTLAKKHMPWDVLLCWATDLSSTAEVRSWIEFLPKWAREIQIAHNEGMSQPPIVSIATAAMVESLPAEDLFLRVRRWQGTPSILEHRMSVRLLSDTPETPDHWREALLPSLALGDLRLQDRLWDEVGGTVEHIETCLIDHGQSIGWTEASLHAWVGNGSKSGTAPPEWSARDLERHHSLWDRGLICQTPEFGPELHSSAAAILGHHDVILHRIWRGQAAVLLPALDSLRLRLCRDLTAHLGNRWPTKWLVPESPIEERETREDPMACGWGHLSRLILRCEQVRTVCNVGRLAALASDMRNSLAHSRPVSRADCITFMGQIS